MLGSDKKENIAICSTFVVGSEKVYGECPLLFSILSPCTEHVLLLIKDSFSQPEALSESAAAYSVTSRRRSP